MSAGTIKKEKKKKNERERKARKVVSMRMKGITRGRGGEA